MVDLLTFGEALGSFLGIGTFAGGILATVILLFAAFACLAALTQRRPSNFEFLFLGFSIMGLSVAIGWLPAWMLIMLTLIIAFMGARSLGRVFG